MLSALKFLLKEGNEITLILLSYQMTEIALIFFSIFIFIIICSLDKHSGDFVLKMSLFFQKLPFTKKFFFLVFILSFAIPNRVYFHNKMSFWLQTFLHLCLFYLCFLFPLFFFIVILRVVFAAESFIFASLCTDSAVFKKVIVNAIFNGDASFADEIFHFFWGNMTSSLKKFASSMSAASAGTFAYSEIRRNEQKNVALEGPARADKAWAQIIKDPQRVVNTSSSDEYLKVLKDSTAAARSETKILATEDAIKNGLTSALKSLF